MKRSFGAGKVFLGILCAMIALFSTTSNSLAAPVQGVTIESVSSEYTLDPWDLRAIHVIDGSGLSGDSATHAQTSTAGNSWQTISQTGTAEIVFDLGASYALTSMHIWNLNFYAPYNGRGAKDVAVSVSSDLDGWESKGTFTFDMATGENGDPGFDILFQENWETGRYVKFDVLSNWGGADNAGHVGLSEVQFFCDTATPSPVPEPATMFLLGSGLIGLIGARRGRRLIRESRE